MLKEFREFAMRGNVVDMAVGIIMGSAFGTIAQSLVKDVLMPPLGLLTGGIEFNDMFVVLKQGVEPGPYATLAQAQSAGAVTINYGVFINNVVAFLLVAVALFFLIRAMNRLRRLKEEEPAAVVEPTTKECRYCCSLIPLKATRCPQCTSALD
ncbi:MAG TPA: large-conductance mechanosensitive channel protein MscL [Gammaproteobacteria bacterium]|nr:large-conductance mechanosensitive channel protein MscL [Gammaproteobacteria bacterium]